MTKRQIRTLARRLVLELLDSLTETPWIEDGAPEGDDRVVAEAARILDRIKASLDSEEKTKR